ncbi:putative transposase [Mycobacterium kansasii]|uniref:Putative transposase n=1 Tax=Mycobacterium kansasii TaxID=1768 RepID=A0A1V3WTT5_MYCKA|nr:putative transposase [Mycobacterium kansasii]
MIGKGGKERYVPVDAAFFTEVAAYLRLERPAGLSTPQCFVVLRGPTTGRRLVRQGCAACFAVTVNSPGPSGCVRIGCAIPMVPNWLLRELICLHYGR